MLPNLIFFDPRPQFVDWLVGYARGRIVIDAGAGVGRLGAMLLERGARCLSLDLEERDEPESPVIMKDATTFEYSRGTLVVLARPCHGNWIYDTIVRTHECGAEVLYVGKPENVENDLEYPGLERRLVGADAGREGEVVYSMKPKPDDKIKYCLVALKTSGIDQGNWWMEDGGDRWINSVGGYRPKGKDEQVLETCWVEDYVDLDHTKTGLLRPEGEADAGWIDRDGKFYGCGSQSHDTVIHLIIKCEVRDVEEKGWMRIYSIERQEWVSNGIRLSAEQRNTASRLGLAIDEDD
ncbi:MAG: hypothetical protein ABFE07_28440 [Armatimonadia bacterium]